MLLLYLAKRNALLAITQRNTKKGQNSTHTQNRSAYCWIVYSVSKSWYRSY